MNQFDSIDLTENVLASLEGFPPMPRLRVLLLSNNHITRIGTGLGQSLPGLETLVLTANRLGTLADLQPLHELKNLRHLLLLENPVRNLPNFREYLIHTIPSLVAIDLTRVRQEDRDRARKLFKGSKGKELKSAINSGPKTFEPGSLGDRTAPSKQQTARVRKAIMEASSLEEVAMLEKALSSGEIESVLKKLGK